MTMPMRPATIILVLAILGLAFARPSSAAQQGSALGLWRNTDQGWVVEVSKCGAKLCGRLVGFRPTQGPNYVAIDRQNPDPSRRLAPLCGLAVMGGFTPTPDTAGQWDQGWIYDTDTGETYQGDLEMTAADRIELRGYVVVPLFGHTLTLVRADTPFARCAVPQQD